MPLPLILAGVAGAAAVAGVKKAYDARTTNKEADAVASRAATIFENAQNRLKHSRSGAAGRLEDLGRLRLKTWDTEIKQFVEQFELLKNIELTGRVAKDPFAHAVVEKTELSQLRDMSLKASEIVSGGLGAAGAGALMGVAAYGGAMTFGAASTGAAISGLSGVAATNATLAWLGGGSLAAGGYGIAGGAAVLGGFVAGPALLVTGWALSAKADANLAKAKASMAEAQAAAADLDKATSALNVVSRLSGQYIDAITRLKHLFQNLLAQMREVIRDAGTDFQQYDDAQQKLIWLTLEAAGALKGLLETPLLQKDGTPREEADKALALPEPLQQALTNKNKDRLEELRKQHRVSNLVAQVASPQWGDPVA